MKQYTEDEERYINENYLELSNSELAKKLDRSIEGIAQKLKDMGLARRNVNYYTEDEKKFIKDNIGIISINEIAILLGRTQGGVSKYVSKFRISGIRKRKKVYLENIDKHVTPFYSKSDNYFEILEKMKPGDSFEFPESDRAVVNNQKYMIINSQKASGKKTYLFTIRKTELRDSIQFCRIWRLS